MNKYSILVYHIVVQKSMRSKYEYLSVNWFFQRFNSTFINCSVSTNELDIGFNSEKIFKFRRNTNFLAFNPFNFESYCSQIILKVLFWICRVQITFYCRVPIISKLWIRICTVVKHFDLKLCIQECYMLHILLWNIFKNLDLKSATRFDVSIKNYILGLYNFERF